MSDKNKEDSQASATDERDAWTKPFRAPAISLPKGGGAIRGMGEKFTANPVTGTGSLSIPIATSPGRSGFGPQLSLSYDSGSGNGDFGFGWGLALPAITRKTDKGLPKYDDAANSDVFLLSGAEDLVPVLVEQNGQWVPETLPSVRVASRNYAIVRYRPRIEGLFARIERWVDVDDPAKTFWRSISRTNVTTWYGRTAESRIADPTDHSRIFSWLMCESYDDKGNVIVYRYVAEDGENVDLTHAHERNRGGRTDKPRTSKRYINRICYGNRVPYLPRLNATAPWPEPPSTDAGHSSRWMFETVFDYDQGHIASLPRNANGNEMVSASIEPAKKWEVRNDPFSTYRAGFEVRTYRRCHRIMMFHHFPGEANVDVDCLVRSTDFTYADELDSTDERNPVFSFLRSVSQSGYQRQGADYLKKSLPPVEFEYTQPRIDPRIHEIAPQSMENAPIGLDGDNYQWVDVESEGLSGILTEQANGWFYKRNVSPVHVVRETSSERAQATFADVELLASKPNSSFARGAAQFMDLAGDGRLDLVTLDEPTPGFYEHDGDSGWASFRAFLSKLNRNTRDPNLRFVDLDGDGHADVLITEDEVFTWHPSLGEEGFGPAARVTKSRDEEKGPALIFSDGTQSIYLADMSGDGLTDLVRIRNGEICYWPNLGYGRFGSKVTMDNAPWFDAPDQFEQRRIHLADVDGSGVTDILYLHGDGVRIYFNESGNSWRAATALSQSPEVHSAANVTVVDLLGNGTACLVWSSSLPNDSRRCMRYIDLMGGQKPHLLIKTTNNLGATTDIQYAPSTKFYLQDKFAGRPWITRLPFPVHVVEKTTISDKWRNTRFSTTYSYHHGYFDGVEREFRGFGRVEQIDVEDFGEFAAANKDSPYITDDLKLYQPPVKTITWFNTGAAIDRERVLSYFQHEYFPNSLAARPASVQIDNVFTEKPLPEPVIELSTLGAQEWREALRACKGMTLRQEVYELAVDPLQPNEGEQRQEIPVRLFSAANHNCNIHRLQAKGDNPHAVFLVTESEGITYHYELDLQKTSPLKPDPRVAHTLNLTFDVLGNVLQSISVGYPRWRQFNDPAFAAHGDLIREGQRERHVGYTENRYTDDAIDRPVAPLPIQHYRLRVPCESLTFELTGLPPAHGRYFDISDFLNIQLSESLQPDAAAVLRKPYHQLPQDMSTTLRLVEHGRTLFFDDDASGVNAGTRFLKKPLPLGSLGKLGLPFEQYKLALTDDMLDAIFTTGRLDQPVPVIGTPRASLRKASVSGYLSGPVADDLFGASTAGEYWMRSGIAGFANDAASHFYLPEQYTDPFDNVTTLEYDGKYDLFVKASKDALGNTTSVFVPNSAAGPSFDYRVLAPTEMVDINGNRTEVYFDVLGLVVASAVKGKGTEADNLIGFDAALASPGLNSVLGYFDLPPLSAATSSAHFGPILLNATTRFLYHFGEANVNGKTEWMNRPAGVCAIVREHHTAALAANNRPGPLQIAFECSDGLGAVLMKRIQAEPETSNGPLRWIISGKTILNNKGKPVKQYEPYFSTSAKCCAEGDSHEEVGVTPIMHYDSLGRLVRTEMPDGSFSRVEFSPWHVLSYDPNDTAYDAEEDHRSDWYKRRTDPAHPRFTEFNNADERRAATLVEMHANTPAATFLDSKGREVASVAHNRWRDSQGTLRDEKYLTFTKLDAEGKPLWVRDARGHLVMQYIAPAKLHDDSSDAFPANTTPCYDIAGNQLYHHSMDTGDRWTLNDAGGKPLFAWDVYRPVDDNTSPEILRLYITEYDALHRATALKVRIDNSAPSVVEKFVYQDAVNAPLNNLNGQATHHYDPSGLVENIAMDFNGGPLEVHRQLAADPQASSIDWQGNLSSKLGNEIWTQITEYDALKRLTRLFNWHRDVTFDSQGNEQATPGATNRVAVYVPSYSERGALRAESLHMRASKSIVNGVTQADTSQATTQQAIVDISYDAKGQRQRLELGNGTVTSYTYDTETFRLRNLRTTRPVPQRDKCSSAFTAASVVQDLRYIYDPVSNITQTLDAAQATVYGNNQRIDPTNRYQYDSLYRLIAASGRESRNASAPSSSESSLPEFDCPAPDPAALRNYTQLYEYDSVGNLSTMSHEADQGNWTQRYSYAFEDAGQRASNRLWRTWQGDATWNGSNATNKVTYNHDTHGSILNVASVAPGQYFQRDYRDMITSIDLIGGGVAHYQYDAGKQRTRKRIENQNGLGGYWERIYLGGFERYRRYAGNGTTLLEEIESHPLFEGDQRVLLVDDVIKTHRKHADGTSFQTDPIFRYQYSNHQGSACFELNERDELISYEEYHPYGTSAYRARAGTTEASPSRFRFTGMERDEESGLCYHTARYYMPWLGRWESGDPIGLGDGVNRYRYAKNNPVTNKDVNGQQTVGTMTGIAASQRREQAEKITLISNIAHHPEQYPWATEKTLAALRAEVSALEKSAGSWETKADRHTDFHKNVGLKVTMAAGGLAVSGPVVGASGLITAFGVGFGFSTLRQGAQVLDGEKKSISLMQSVEEGGWAGAFSAVSKVPGSKYGFAGLGVISSAHEFSQGHGFTGTLDAATSVFALRKELFNFKINASIQPRLGAPATQSVATLGIAIDVTSGQGSPSSPFNVLMVGQTSSLMSIWRTMAGRTLKADAGSIHGEDQWRGGQTIITAKLQLPNGGKVLVAAPNSGAGWRPGQRDLAIRLGYSPIDPYSPGSEIHAEGNLQSALSDRNSPYFGARVLGWAISRGRTGSSIICNEGCTTFTNRWGPQHK